MADVNSMMALGIPAAVARTIEAASPTVPVLMAYGCSKGLADAIANNSGVPALMANGLSALQAVEVNAELND